MPLIVYVTHDGNQFEVDVPVGTTLMDGAVDNDIDGIVGECGGNLSCATCHCYLEEPWLAKIGKAEGAELEMVEATVDPRPNSRLSCQITVTADMEGLAVYMPESQY